MFLALREIFGARKRAGFMRKLRHQGAAPRVELRAKKNFEKFARLVRRACFTSARSALECSAHHPTRASASRIFARLSRASLSQPGE